ncbi:hypothetical protein ACJ72_08165 [Emergomyces africanus]|uniref:Uncharacterized protein n=1 Tax=Emergomyces africanus TaxID=1955775 RepID=A0A1B7NL71_9EURO|nr:hypothetical protein ACJ72_08165 [Emergomyces africanus]
MPPQDDFQPTATRTREYYPTILWTARLSITKLKVSSRSSPEETVICGLEDRPLDPGRGAIDPFTGLLQIQKISMPGLEMTDAAMLLTREGFNGNDKVES